MTPPACCGASAITSTRRRNGYKAKRNRDTQKNKRPSVMDGLLSLNLMVGVSIELIL